MSIVIGKNPPTHPNDMVIMIICRNSYVGNKPSFMFSVLFQLAAFSILKKITFLEI